MPVPTFGMDLRGRVCYFNVAASLTMGHASAAVKSDYVVRLICDEDLDLWKAVFSQLPVRHGETMDPVLLRFKKGDGSLCPMTVQFLNVYSPTSFDGINTVTTILGIGIEVPSRAFDHAFRRPQRGYVHVPTDPDAQDMLRSASMGDVRSVSEVGSGLGIVVDEDIADLIQTVSASSPCPSRRHLAEIFCLPPTSALLCRACCSVSPFLL